jgi:hypothetical protein
MKIWTSICAVGLSICGLLSAQIPVDTITVHFASPVMVGEKTMPAGECTIHVIRGSGDNVLLSVRGESGATTAVLVNRLNDGPDEDNASVVLTKRGKDLRLDKVWLPDHTGFSVVPPSE